MLKKLKLLFTPKQKGQLGVLVVLLFFGMFFEMLGIGVLLPLFNIMLSENLMTEYPYLAPYAVRIGNPSQQILVIYAMIILVFIYFIKSIYLVFLTWRQSKFSSEMFADLSERLFVGYLCKPYTFHLQKNSSELLRNIQTEVGLFLSVSQYAITFSIELSAALGIFLMLFFIEPVGALSVIFFMFFSAQGFHKITKKRLLKWGKKRQFHDGAINKHLLQGLNGVKDVKILGREKDFINFFSLHNKEKAKITIKQSTLILIPRFYLEFLAVMGLAVLTISLVIQEKASNQILPTLGVFLAAAFRMIPSGNRMMSAIQYFKYAEPVVNLLSKEFSSIETLKINKNQFGNLLFSSEINLENITYRYPNVRESAIKNINLSIKKGSSIGIIGASGSGKSTLVDVLLGLLSPSKGQVNIDSVDYRNDLRQWQNIIGYVPQNIYLTDDTLLNNIAFGISEDNIEMELMNNAVNLAQLDDYVNSLAKGLQTIVGERGIRLSGGQRQRIGIARALYHNPEILILDEATSALDSKTETDLMRGVDKMRGKKTLIIVAHRLSTVANCDMIVKLEKGRIVQRGAPKEVLNSNVI